MGSHEEADDHLAAAGEDDNYDNAEEMGLHASGDGKHRGLSGAEVAQRFREESKKHKHRALAVTKPYECIGFGALAVTKPSEFHKVEGMAGIKLFICFRTPGTTCSRALKARPKTLPQKSSTRRATKCMVATIPGIMPMRNCTT